MEQPNPRSNWSLSDDARHKMVNKIMDTLQKHMPLSGAEGMNDLRKIASRFEEKIYTAAADQQDYLRRISLKMLSLETKAQGPGTNPSGTNQQPLDPGLMMQQQRVRNSSQTIPNGLSLPGQSQPRHQLQQNLQNSMGAGGMQNSSALPSISNLSEGTGGQGFGTQSSVVNHSTGQVLNQGALLQRQMPIRQQQHQQQVVQQHQQAPQQLLYQQHLQQQQQALLKQKFQQQSQLVPSMLQQQQQHQQPVMQQTQLPTSQQSIMQPVQPPALQSNQQSLIQQSQTSVLQPTHQPILQQPQQSSLQQTSQSLLQQHQQQQQSAIRHQQSQQVAMQQQSSMLQQQQQPSAVNVSNMHQQQHQLQQILQSKTAQHQQTQQPSSALLLSQSQQLQQQSQQQQILTQLQAQPQQLQQQQPFPSQSNTLQHDLQQMIHPSGGLLQQQQQNSIEQQKQLGSTAQSGQPTVDMQEKNFQRLQRLKETYFPEIKDLFLRLHQKSQQPMPPEQAEKLQQYKTSLQRFVQYLNYPRGNIPPGLKEEKLDIFEKQLQNILSQGRQKKPALQQQGQQQLSAQSGSQVQSMQQQSQPPIPQMQQQEKHVNQLQQMNLQAQVSSMQSNTVSPIQHGSMPLLQQSVVQTSQQNTGTLMQTGTNLNPAQGTVVGSLQQSSVSSLQHNSNVNPLQNSSNIQQNSMSSLQHSGINHFQQNNISPLQSNANSLQHQQQAKQQDILQAQHLKQRQIQFLAQQQQQQQQQQVQQQHLQQQQQLQRQQFQQQQHIQQFQQKQQQAAQLQAQFQAQQMSQLPQINELNNDSKLKQVAAVKQALIQRSAYQQQQQFKPGSSLPVSSPQLLPTVPQVCQQSSPQIDQQNLVASSLPVPKPGTPLQHVNSPFTAPSPSSVPAPSPLEEAEKPSSAISSISNLGSGQGLQQTATTVNNVQSLAIATPGISASPLLDGFSPTPAQSIVNQDQTVSSGFLMGNKSGAKEPPLERLLKVINSISPKALASAVNDIDSVVSLIDRMAGSAPGNGSRAAVGEDLVAMTKCRLQARNLMSQDGSAATKKMKRHMSSMPLSTVSSGGTVTNSFQQHSNQESPEMESTATSRIKRPRVEMSHALQDELREINQNLIDTSVDVSEDDDDAAMPSAGGRDGIVLKCSYNAIALSPNMKSRYRSSQITPISPLRLLIPTDYPNSSPVLLDKAPAASCKEYDDLSSRAKAEFHAAVRTLKQPMSLIELARTWDAIARNTVTEYAHQNGGGSFSSKFGTWESCNT